MATILVVDDRAINREFMATLLGYGGHRVIEAGNGAAALARSRETQPDLVIADVLMPEMGGVEFARRLRADAAMARIPIIFYTAAHRLDEVRRYARSCARTTLLAKPSPPEAILDAVATALGPAAAGAATPPAGADGETRNLTLRLSALLELGLGMLAQRDPQQLLDLAARSAQDILAARHALIVIGDGTAHRPERFSASGFAPETRARFAGLDPGAGVFGAVLADGRPRHLDAAAAADALPPWHPPVQTLLVVPIKSATRAYGWLSLADSQCHRAGGDCDEQLAATLAAQLAQSYENLAYAARLEAEIAERRKNEDELKLAASVFDNTMDGIMVTDTEARIVSVNPAFTAITGYSAEEAVGQKPSLMRSEHHGPDFYRELWETLLREGRWEGEVWNRRKDGEAFLEWLTIGQVKGADGETTRYVGVFNDITELRRKDEHIRHLAFHDPLTGLPNRTLLLDRLEHGIAFAAREKQQLGVMFVDLDRFKLINDSLGHNIGDGLLQEVARRLSLCVRQSDTVARIGGDEFVIVLEHVDEPERYAALAQTIVSSLTQPFYLGGDALRISTSIGIACFPNDGRDVFELMKHADTAMYAAKSSGRGTYRFFQPAMTEDATQRLQLEMELRNAAANGELELYYQPTVSLSDDAAHSVEALLRWWHPMRGLVLPSDFIPLAEETGAIVELGDWVLEEACRQNSSWQARGLGPIRIAVTIATKQLQQGDLVERIATLTRRYGIAPASLELKLTESIIMADPERVTRIFARLHELGVAVAVDGFGTGYSTLACLRRLPIDSLSIDRSFVKKAEHDEKDARVVRSIVALGQALNIQVVAEGVETESQSEFLKACGCTVVQGYLYAQPAPASHIEVWLRAHRGGEGEAAGAPEAARAGLPASVRPPGAPARSP